jgi:pSer/pThr/pTyr-binding forkhead associated (FHA) protein
VIRLTAVIDLDGQAPRALTHESNALSIIVGRDSTADFVLPLSTISRHHARISAVDRVYTIEDLGSTHGTAVNGRPLEAGAKRVLRHGDLIELTRAKITCAIETSKIVSVEPGEGTQAIASRAVQGILGRLGEAKTDGPSLRIISGAGEGTRFSLSGAVQEWSLGRSRDCEFVLQDPNVSRRHAVIRKDWNGFTLHDLGSKNGVLLADKPMAKPRRLRDKDEITVGPIRLVFIDPDADLLAALKDVPGFGNEEESDVGEAPAGEAPADLPPPDGEAPGAVSLAGAEPVRSEADDLEGIDPALLTIPSKGSRQMSMVLLGALVLGAVLCLTGLYFLL